MNHNIAHTLAALTSDFVTQWEQAYQSRPIANEMQGLPSPCLQTSLGSKEVEWLPQERDQVADFGNLERGIELIIHSDIKAFYGSQYSADLTLSWNNKPFTLLQVWSDEDFVTLQENILGHLVTQRRLKLKPTVFIGTTDAELDVVSICNMTGEVILERLGTANRDVLSPNIEQFLTQCKVEV
ncbi:SecY-interacting protein [Vibrio sp. S11_S32]|uniref:SecY-interacting protein n=1 Tax=Vibrio sp. S11_S32 TaxID=2720225 RepID=UPI001681AFF7|nr:SecY-interacting protein [Vibrio sp. S11_S32]MBD1575094.1 SecY-interacting protein [Vibrio sp. S11_S32]